MKRDENGFVRKLVEIFKINNFRTFEEVIPDQCDGWEKPYRVDLIVYRDDVGYIGIEAKYLNTIGQGGIIAQAFEQIKKYKDLTYFRGNYIKKWCIAPRFQGMGSERAIVFIRTFLKYFDISTLELHEYDNIDYNYISIDALTKDALRFKRVEHEW